MKAYHPLIIASNASATTAAGHLSISSSVDSSVGKSIHRDLASRFPINPKEMSLLGMLIAKNKIHLPQARPQCVNRLKAADVGSVPIKKRQRPKVPKRDTSVSLEEMKRLMRVYGPVKVLRNRGTTGTEQSVKPDSIRRKFYRWFPDFNERFAKTPEGWYVPKAGHEHEMEYREAMRKMDQEVLIRKRSATKRFNTKARKSG